jgi:hypothetical protein
MSLDAPVQLVRNFLCCIKDLAIFDTTWLYNPEYTIYFLPHEWILWGSLYEALMGKSGYAIWDLQQQYPFQTTPLELFIGYSQLFACLSCSYTGIRNGIACYQQLSRIQRLLKMTALYYYEINSDESSAETGKKKKKSGAAPNPTESHLSKAVQRLMMDSLQHTGDLARRQLLVNLFCITPIGIAFFWLVANSWHFSYAANNILNGVPGIIHALSVMEMALVPLLQCMWSDASNYGLKAKQIQVLLSKLQQSIGGSATSAGESSGSPLQPTALNIQSFSTLTHWKPYWTEEGKNMDEDDDKKEMKRLHHEMDVVYDFLTQYTLLPAEEERRPSLKKSSSSQSISEMLSSAVTSTITAAVGSVTTTTLMSSQHGDSDQERKKQSTAAKRQKEQWKNRAKELETEKRKMMCYCYREYSYFLLNLAAFWGYLVGVLAYYYDDDTATSTCDASGCKAINAIPTSQQPALIRQYVMLNYTKNSEIDWLGNFVGDFCWTLEPAVILLSPLIISELLSLKTKRQPSPAVVANKRKKGSAPSGKPKSE